LLSIRFTEIPFIQKALFISRLQKKRVLPFGSRAIESRAIESRAIESRAIESRAIESRAIESRAKKLATFYGHILTYKQLKITQ
jgi:hypothetical protein